MRKTEREIHRELESLEEDLAEDSETDDDHNPFAIIIGDEPLDHYPDAPHGNGIRTFPSREAAEAELGEDVWEYPGPKVWDLSDQSESSGDDTT